MRLKQPLRQALPVLPYLGAWMLLLPVVTSPLVLAGQAAGWLAAAWLMGFVLLVACGVRLAVQADVPAETTLSCTLHAAGRALTGFVLGIVATWALLAGVITLNNWDDNPVMCWILLPILLIGIPLGGILGLVLGLLFPTLQQQFRTMYRSIKVRKRALRRKSISVSPQK